MQLSPAAAVTLRRDSWVVSIVRSGGVVAF
jgi:hypothetical protein